MTEQKSDSAYWMEDIIRISDAYKDWQARVANREVPRDRNPLRRRQVDGGRATSWTSRGYSSNSSGARSTSPSSTGGDNTATGRGTTSNNGQTLGLPLTLRKLYEACPWARAWQ